MDWAEVRDRLLSQPTHPPAEALTATYAGIYAWYDQQGALAPFYPSAFPRVDPSLPLYVGLAKKDTLSDRIVGTHLADTRRSSLRRSLAVLLCEELELLQGVVPFPKGKYGLGPDYERALTGWISEGSLRVTWVAHESPELVEKQIIGNLCSPMNYTYATGSVYRRQMWMLRRQLRANALRHS